MNELKFILFTSKSSAKSFNPPLRFRQLFFKKKKQNNLKN